MKGIIRHFAVNGVSLYLASLVAHGLIFEKGIETILLAGLGLSISAMIVEPVINLFMLPINLITFNLFRWVSSAIALYLVTLVVPGFIISGFVFSGFANSYFSIPAFSLFGFLSYIAFSFTLSFISAFMYWLAK